MGETIEEDSSYVSKVCLWSLCWKFKVKRAKLSYVQLKVLFLTLISEDGIEGDLAKNMGLGIQSA